MKINRRLKILREKLGYSQEAFTQILFEDFDIQEQKKYQKAYPQIEAGIQAVDLTLVEQVLIKFRPYPFWLISGEKQMDSEMSKLIEKFAIQQYNDNSSGNSIEINIVEDKELTEKSLAENDRRLKKVYTEIEKLKQNFTILAETYSDTINQSRSNSRFIKSVAIVLSLLLISTLLFFFNTQQSGQVVAIKLPKSKYYERFIKEGQQNSSDPYIDYESQKYRTIIHLLKNFPDKEVKLRLIDYRERIK